MTFRAQDLLRRSVIALAVLTACTSDRFVEPLTETTAGGPTTTIDIPIDEMSLVSCQTCYYAAPGGSPSGTGELSSPWDLQTALNQTSLLVGGRTLFLRGGTYSAPTNGYDSYIAGNAYSSRVVIRNYPGEYPVLDGTGTGPSQTVLAVYGTWSHFHGFEIMSSEVETRTTLRPHLIANYADFTYFSDLILHDGGVAVYSENTVGYVHFYGNIIYNNGWDDPEPYDENSRGHGHGLYVKSDVGGVVAHDNVIFNNFGYGIHAFSNSGSGMLNNMNFQWNTVFNGGLLSDIGPSPNILLGGDPPNATSTGSQVSYNRTYFPSGYGATNVRIGQSSTSNGSVTVSGNYLVGGNPVMEIRNWSNPTISNDTLVFHTTRVLSLQDASLSGYSWGSNRYYASGSGTLWRYLSTDYSLTGTTSFQSQTGLGVGSDATVSGSPPQNVVVRPSIMQPGRALVTIFNNGTGDVAVSLTDVLFSGDTYEVRNVQQLGTVVASGTYGSSITFPMAGVAATAPKGMSSSPAPQTGPAFNVFLVTRTSNPTLTAEMDGPTEISSSGSYQWRSIGTGPGFGNYAFRWEYRALPSGSWQLLSNLGWKYTRSVNPATDPSFEIRLTVIDLSTGQEDQVVTSVTVGWL